MPDLTLAQRFGDRVSFNSTSKILSINLNDLASIPIDGSDYGLNSDDLTTSNQDQYASKILWALIQLSRSNQPENNNDETVGIYVANQGKRSVVRNQVSQFGFVLGVTAYKYDSLGSNLDPDSIGEA